MLSIHQILYATQYHILCKLFPRYMLNIFNHISNIYPLFYCNNFRLNIHIFNQPFKHFPCIKCIYFWIPHNFCKSGDKLDMKHLVLQKIPQCKGNFVPDFIWKCLDDKLNIYQGNRKFRTSVRKVSKLLYRRKGRLCKDTFFRGRWLCKIWKFYKTCSCL